MPRETTKHHLGFLCLAILSLAAFRLPLTTLLSVSSQDDRDSHVLLILSISAGLLYFGRESIFREPRFCLTWGLPLLLLGAVLCLTSQTPEWFSDQNDYLSYSTFSFVYVWVAAFVLSYGTKVLQASRFPLSFLVLMIPIPTVLLDRTIGFLQRASADVTHGLFEVAGVPVDWLGLGFVLRGSHFEIAKECSGIHSSLILFVMSILAGHLFLRSLLAKVCFSVFTVFVAIFKNAVRVVTIACLTAYVDGSFYDSWVHRKGGLIFGAFALAILAPSLLALRKAESHFRPERPAPGTKEDVTAEGRADCVSRDNEVA